jgi:hypothetical protein
MAKFIQFVKADENHEGNPMYWIANKRSGDTIGQVFWYGPWHQWTCRFKEDSVWSQDCLADVREFILSL